MKIRTISRITVSTLLIFVEFNISAQDNTGWHANPKVVKELTAKNAGSNYYEDKVPAFTLPDALTSKNGVRIISADQWNLKRRPEIIEMFRHSVYGRVPETPYGEEMKTVYTDRQSLEGKATEKHAEIKITHNNDSLIIHLTLFTPNNVAHPVPAFLVIDNWPSGNSDQSWKIKDEFFPVREALKRGYGMAVFSSADLDPDNFDNFKNGIHGLLDKAPRPADAWGTLAAWAWGASRCMDYMVKDKDISDNKIAIVGHSRGGKTALWAGAEDSRFALVVSNESGAGGAALARRRYGETVERLNTVFPHWFCANYKQYNNMEDSLPVDTHMLLALIAPRPLYIDCADLDLWGDPLGSYMALYNAVPVYKLLGNNSDIPMSMPQLNKQIISGKVGFHIRDGAHNLLLRDWTLIMDFADRFLK